MLDSIIHFSIRNKLIIGVFTLALIVWGCWSATRLSIDAVPDITNNQVQVVTSSPSLAAQEIEKLITYPIEISMANIPELVEIRSISRFGLSVVTIVFEENTDIYWARQQVNERLKTASELIPPGIGVPDMAPLTTGLGEIYQYILRTKHGFEGKYTSMELRTFQDAIIRKQLLGTPGVADVSSFGGFVKQYEISIEPGKLRSMGITISEIFTAVQNNNQNAGGAYIDKKPNAWFIRTEGLVKNIEDIENIVVKNTLNNTPVLVKDVANVQLGHAIRYGAMTFNNEGEVVGGIVMMLKGENSNEVIEKVKSKIVQISKTLPEGVVIEPFIDRTRLVNNAIHTVATNLIEGALIVIFVLVLLMGNIRAGFIVASVIPLAMLFTVSAMNITGVSGNLMSLGAIDFGLIVDGAVIIVEAVLFRLESRIFFKKESIDDLVYQSSSQIRNSAAFGEIIILIVYLPILALVGIEGKMFRPMAQTVAFAIIGAFILSLTYVPMMSALILKEINTNSYAHKVSERIMHFFQKVYVPILLIALKRKTAVIFISVTSLGISLILFFRLGGEFIPSLDEGDFAVETRVLTGSSMQQTIDVALKSGKILMSKFPEVIKVIGKIGTSEIPLDPMPLEACDLMIILKDKSEWTSASTREELSDKMQLALEEIPGVTFGFQQPIQMRFNELMSGARQDVAIKIYGDDLDKLAIQAEKLGLIANKVQGVKDLYVEKITGLSQIVIEYNRARLAQYGINIKDVNNVVQAAFAGQSAGLVFEGEKRFDIVIRFDQLNRQNIEDVRNLFIKTAAGINIPITQVAEVNFKMGPNQIQRDDTKRRITVAFNVRGRDVKSVVEEIQILSERKLQLPVGYYMTFGGQFQNLMEAENRLSIAVPVALALIFILLYFTFNSLTQALLIFSAIPFSTIGGILALWLRNMPFSISAGVGFIALFGVAVLNGIVLIGEFNRIKLSGENNLEDIVKKGTNIRLRPVIMTALVASLGFLPMALSTGAGAEVQKPLATVVIGGLFTATLLTLVVLPILYIISERKDIKSLSNNPQV